MNYFKTIKAALDAPYGPICCHMNISVEQAPQVVQNRPLALERYRQHDPTSEFLFSPPPGATEEAPKPKRVELSLFDDLAET
jgi:hypothetical protein